MANPPKTPMQDLLQGFLSEQDVEEVVGAEQPRRGFEV